MDLRPLIDPSLDPILQSGFMLWWDSQMVLLVEDRNLAVRRTHQYMT